MAEKTKIRWTDKTWNPATGCTKVSPGCANCYAEAIAEKNRGGAAFPDGFAVTLRPHRVSQPLKWTEPSRVFVNSMSDLFHRDIPDDYLVKVWEVMLKAPQHQYQILTKRPHRAKALIERLGLELAPHIWLGVSVENQTFADNRIPALIQIPAKIRWISAEPLLGPVDLTEWIDPVPEERL